MTNLWIAGDAECQHECKSGKELESGVAGACSLNDLIIKCGFLSFLCLFWNPLKHIKAVSIRFFLKNKLLSKSVINGILFMWDKGQKMTGVLCI